MVSTKWRQRRSVVALIVILLAVFAAVPSASATSGQRHGRHIQHFLVMSTDPSENAPPLIIANGPIHAQGTDVVVSETRDIFKFPKGTLSIRHHAKKRSMKESFDPVTCLFKYRERGIYKVTGGTGAYAKARGHGHYSVRVSGVGCDETAAPDPFSLEIKASGPLHL